MFLDDEIRHEGCLEMDYQGDAVTCESNIALVESPGTAWVLTGQCSCSSCRPGLHSRHPASALTICGMSLTSVSQMIS